MGSRAALVTFLLLSSLLGACSQAHDEKETEREVGPPLTTGQIRSALLTSQDLGKQFVSVPPDSDDSDPHDLGCLGKVDRAVENGPQPLREVTAAFEPSTQLKSPSIETTVATFKSARAAASSLDLMLREQRKCTRADVRDDGTRFRFQVRVDDLAVAHEADQQVTTSAAVDVSGRGLRFPMTVEITLVRIGRNAVAVAMFDMQDSLQGARRALTDAAMDRLVAVMEGRKPPRPERLLSAYPFVKPRDLAAGL
jgi:hypothetical protein